MKIEREGRGSYEEVREKVWHACVMFSRRGWVTDLDPTLPKKFKINNAGLLHNNNSYQQSQYTRTPWVWNNITY